MTEIAIARPASTVVLLRNSSAGMEALMLRRNKALQFAGGLWVFPGGAVDDEDRTAAGDDPDQAARFAAAREAMEEAGLAPQLDRMVMLSHWTTPIVEPKRFATWIYAAPVETTDEVTIDGSEIHEARWVALNAAIAAHEAGELGMLPPTYITLCDLARYEDTDAMVAGERSRSPDTVFPVFASDPNEMIVMFDGDAGYASADCHLEGPQHRAIFEGGRWRYVHRDVAAHYPAFIRVATA